MQVTAVCQCCGESTTQEVERYENHIFCQHCHFTIELRPTRKPPKSTKTVTLKSILYSVSTYLITLICVAFVIVSLTVFTIAVFNIHVKPIQCINAPEELKLPDDLEKILRIRRA